MLFKRCDATGKFLIFRKKIKHKGKWYSQEGYEIVLEMEEEEQNLVDKLNEERKRSQSRIKKEKKAKNEKKANEQLKAELEQAQKKQLDREQKAISKKKSKASKKSTAEKESSSSSKGKSSPSTKSSSFSQKELSEYKKLLEVHVDVKRIRAIEYIDGKSRVVLNKDREIRRTHAGGYSAEKFQKFVDQKKAKSLEWVIGVLEKPGVLRLPYDKIRVSAKDEGIQKALEVFLNQLNR